MADQREPVGEDVVEAMATIIREGGRFPSGASRFSPAKSREIAKAVLPFITAAERRGEERMRGHIADWLEGTDVPDLDSDPAVAAIQAVRELDLAAAIKSLDTSGGA